jgi:hypothetical protein
MNGVFTHSGGQSFMILISHFRLLNFLLALKSLSR